MRVDALAHVVSADKRSAFTLAEVVMAVGISAMLFGGIITAYTLTARRAEWAGDSMAAQAVCMQQLEQSWAALWDTQATPATDQITNLSLQSWKYTGGVWRGYTNTILDLPISGNNYLIATNFVTVRMITNSVNPLVTVHMIQVDTVWPFRGKQFTNTIVTYRAPDQ